MKTKFLALAFIAAAPFAASADTSYSYVDFSYQTGSVDPGADFDGFIFKGSYGFNDSWFVEFDYGDFGFDPAGDMSDMALFLGWHGETFYAKLGFEDLEVVGFSDSGYALDFGARAMVSDAFELNGHVGYADLGTFDTFTSYGIGAVWMFGDNMGVSFNYDMRSADGGDIDHMGVGFRMNFN